ncbi:hypothetical protein SUS17_2666 [Sphingomonas sp. S17]|uniref:Uncharacterized protein n=2 Tax=Sphingomonas paucimobilis TaxID=13689 RepID=A0A7Y2PDC8_SPHPI|nr:MULTISPECIES: hypothetical protein [Sphingomonas]EGI54481.1 hypothetical protein SUS17_2666 [Sphingomonas sp. S17]MCM3680882.1 hypothetical protein [Sphingomonas paucimobilis]MDG5971409.1 hypothetical protein [Sphingomonas paucimobilis]NNG58716.1 hypothetical protein [Sphingomonas paucimobilis]QPS15971.1 hypothetical protein I6G65_17010 [Sphingomonas paucimobilis]
MYDRMIFAAVAAGLLTFAAPGYAADPAAMDVAGIRLGDTPQQVKAALQQAGYRVTETRKTASFAQRVAVEVANRNGAAAPNPTYAGIAEIIAMGSHQERADIQFAQIAGGDSVSRVEVTIPGTAMGEAAMKAQLSAKYGKPDAVKDQGLSWHWCAPQAMKICGMTYTGGELDTAWPTLRGSTGMGTNSIILEAGTDADRRLKQAFDAAVLARAPKTDRAAF